MIQKTRFFTVALVVWSVALPAFAGGDGEHHGFHVDSFFIGQAINFGLLLFLFIKFGKPALNKYFAERRKNIASDLDEATRLKKEAEETFAEYDAKLSKLDQELAELRADMIKAGEVERDRIVEEAEGKAARLRKDNQFIIDQRGKQLRLDLRREATEATVESARQALKDRLTSEDHRRLAEEFLKELSVETSAQNVGTAPGRQPSRGVV